MERCTEVQVPVSFPSLVFLNPLMVTSQYSHILPYFSLVKRLMERDGHTVNIGRDRGGLEKLLR